MIAHVCDSTGWTWDYVADNLDLPRIGHLNDYWREHPPVHILVASYMGIKPSSSPGQSETDEAEAIGMLGGNKLSEDEFNALLKAKGII
ncbi:MAG: hypothetical protein KHW43_09625 [Neisseria sp.]|nr:hypothetical protein [Neisseria sp.]